MTTEQLQKQIAELQLLLDATNQKNQDLVDAMARARQAKNTGPSCRVTDKGGVSFYHGSRFPVTLYKEQWKKLFQNMAQIEAFINANEERLPTKEEAKAKAKEQVEVAA